MKTQIADYYLQMSRQQLEGLTTIVNETLATGINIQKAKVFTDADLWNIRRQVKVRVQRRFLF